jgi:predicted RNA-binding Zn-ribbon protein involved in translation (DUF1610 family)
MNRTYICDDCDFIFQVYRTTGVQGKRYFCPSCGENMETRVHHGLHRGPKEHIKNRKKHWSAEETALAEKCLAGKLQPHQVMLQTGRSRNSVMQKLTRMRDEANGLRSKPRTVGDSKTV